MGGLGVGMYKCNPLPIVVEGRVRDGTVLFPHFLFKIVVKGVIHYRTFKSV